MGTCIAAVDNLIFLFFDKDCYLNFKLACNLIV